MKLTRSPVSTKKWRAIFSDGRHTDFGDPSYQDYTQHRDEARREAYRKRHEKDLASGDPRSAGFLSYFILWGDRASVRANVKTYNRMFGRFL